MVKLGQIRKHSNNAAEQKSTYKESLIEKPVGYQHLMTDQGGIDDTTSNGNTTTHNEASN